MKNCDIVIVGRRDIIAKNLLENKLCDKCKWALKRVWNRSKFCTKFQSLYPEDNTCKRWE
jgi:hypothetical protein